MKSKFPIHTMTSSVQHDLGSTKETIIVVVVVKCTAVVVQRLMNGRDVVSFSHYPTPQPVHSPFQDNVV